MAYNYYAPYQTPMYNAPQMQMPQQTQQSIPQALPQQMQSGGFMSVRTEQEARNYPVAPGNVITFKIENQPIVCEKAQGFSQLEGPIFNKYRLVKEEEVEETVVEPINTTSDIQKDIEYLKEEVKILKERLYSKPKNFVKTPENNKGGNKE